MKGNLKRPDFRELMNPLLRTTAGIAIYLCAYIVGEKIMERIGESL